ncbi:MAG: oligosaccharide flippase family protein [Microgenomates group bacterium]
MTSVQDSAVTENTSVIDADDLAQIKRKSVSGAVSYFGRTIFLNVIGLGSAVLLSIFFEPEDFGIYGFVIQIIGILTFFSDIGLAAALVQKKLEPSLAEYRTAFTVQQILSWLIVLLTLGIIATGWIEEKTGTAGVWILIALAISFPLASLKTISSVLLERKLDFSKLVIPSLFEQVAFYGILVYMAWQNFGVISYAYAIIVRSILGSLVMMFIQPWSLGIAFDKESFKTLFSFGFKFQLNDFLARIKDQLFYLALGSFLPLREFGYVSWAKQWSLYPYNLTVQNVMAITFPTFSRLQHNTDALKRAIEKTLFFITLVIFPIITGMSVFIYPLLAVFPEYEKWTPAALALILFSLSVGWSAISSPLTNTLNAIGEISTTLKLMIFWTVTTWILTPLLIWVWGYNGVAIAALIISFSSYLPIKYVQEKVKFDFVDQVWRQLVASIVMATVAIFGADIWTSSVSHLLLGMITSGLVYALTVFSLGKDKILSEFRGILRSRK